MPLTCSAVDTVSIEVARGPQSSQVRAGLQWDWNRRWLESDKAYLGGYWDLTLAEWRERKYQNVEGASKNFGDIGLTPVLRYQRLGRTGFYAEAGIGAHFLSDLYDNDGRQLSTRFEFGDHLGAGYIFENHLDLGLKFQHFSNGGIKEPNGGVNFTVLRASYRF
ncbi:acyloxyacyl hydrolase [Undibacterium arcticum]|uniref:Acyloxyacyl hydrolase n=1 Tax=Undibacterium arcticum TaxID=1762892 RepID=A0ABV7F4Y3_9BURK